MPFERAFGERGLRVVAASSLVVVGLVLVGVPLSAGAAGLAVAATAAAAAAVRLLWPPRRARDGARNG